MEFEKNELGNKVYVWTRGGGKANQQQAAVISSHGGQAIFNGKFDVKAGMTLHFYCPHGWVLSDPSLHDVILGNAIIKETVTGARRYADYKLSKYQGQKHGSERESYANIAPLGMTDDDLVGIGFTREQLAARPTPLPLDIITIRSRDYRVSPMLSDVLKLLRDKGWNYQTIHCSFCRCPQLKTELGTWDAG